MLLGREPPPVEPPPLLELPPPVEPPPLLLEPPPLLELPPPLELELPPPLLEPPPPLELELPPLLELEPPPLEPLLESPAVGLSELSFCSAWLCWASCSRWIAASAS